MGNAEAKKKLDFLRENGSLAPPNLILRDDVLHLMPTMYPKAIQDLKILRRVAEKSAPTPQQSFYGTTGAVYYAEAPLGVCDQVGKIALKVVYSFNNDSNQAVYLRNENEIELHKYICSLEGSKRFFVQFYSCWIEDVDFSVLPDWNADRTLTNNRSLFIAFEYIPMNLLQCRNVLDVDDLDRTLGDTELYLIAYQISKAIEFLQDHHIAHRDIKPDNILVDHLGRALLGDFGTAIRFKPDQNMKYLYEAENGFSKGGAPLFTPPEILNQKPGEGVYLDFLTYDVYSLAMSMAEVAPSPESEWGTSDLFLGMTSVENPSKRLPIGDVIPKLLDQVARCSHALNRFGNHPVLQEIRKDGANIVRHVVAEAEAEAKSENPKAETRLGYLFISGAMVPKNEPLGFEYIERAANRGYLEAEYSLGVCYDNGHGVMKDAELAFHWFKIAADKGHVRAQVQVGHCYQTGRGVAPNPTLGVDYYKMAADQYNPIACFCLGRAYEEGIGVPENRELSSLYFQAGAQQGSPQAQNYYAILRCIKAETSNQPEQWKQSIQELTKAAEQADPDAQHVLGLCYYQGKPGLSQDFECAARFFRQAAERGLRDSQWMLGQCYSKGQGVDQNEAEAMKNYRSAAAQGHPAAQVLLANLYLQGIGVVKSIPTAIKYLESVVEGDHVASNLIRRDAMYALSLLYYQKEGGVQDQEKGQHYLVLATNNGHPDAQAILFLHLIITQTIQSGEYQDIPKHLKVTECSFLHTPHEALQPFFQCHTCWPGDESHRCCLSCTFQCHLQLEHDLAYLGLDCSRCDCGKGDSSIPCRCLGETIPPVDQPPQMMPTPTVNETEKKAPETLPRAEPSLPFQLQVSTFGGKTYTLEVEESDLIETIKKKLQNQLQIPSIDNLLLIFCGKQMENTKTLGFYKVTKESTLQYRILN